MRLSRTRMPNEPGHSAPEYVVGTDTTGKAVSTETALARSIALPPPTASSPSAPAAASTRSAMRSLGTSFQRPVARSGRSAQRSLATTYGRRMPSSARSGSSCSSPQRTITAARARTRGPPRRTAGGADERDVAGGVEPFDPRGREGAGREVGRDGGSRDEGDAVAG